MVKKKREIVNLNLRLPVGLHRRLVEQARQKNPPVSLNSLIINLLQGVGGPGTLEELISEARKSIADSQFRLEALEAIMEDRKKGKDD